MVRRREKRGGQTGRQKARDIPIPGFSIASAAFILLATRLGQIHRQALIRVSARAWLHIVRSTPPEMCGYVGTSWFVAHDETASKAASKDDADVDLI